MHNQIQETKKAFESTEIFLLKKTVAALSDPVIFLWVNIFGKIKDLL